MEFKEYRFEQYLNVRAFHGPSFSPDGKILSFLTNITGVDEVWSVPVEMQAQRPSWPTQLTFRGERVNLALFSPKEEVLLTAGDVGGNERTQLYTLNMHDSTLTALTQKAEVIHAFGDWSPDGTRISYSSNERDRRYFDVYEYDRKSGITKRLLQQDGTNHVSTYSPDGLQTIASRYKSNTCNQLLLVHTLTGAIDVLTAEIATAPCLYRAVHWSASQEGIYVLSNAKRQFLSLAYIDLTTKELSYLTDRAWDIETLEMTADGTRMALVTNEDGYSQLEIFDVTDGWKQRKALPLPSLSKGVIDEVSWSQDGKRLAITFNSATDSPGIWVWDIETGLLWRATPSSLGGISQESFVSPSLIRYSTFDKREIPAFLYLPHGKQEQLPVVMYIHGGPEGQSLPSFNPVIQYFAARGYGVLAPNVRGSKGYGYEYQSLDDVRLRMNSVADLKYAYLWLKESGIADEKRVVVMGGSYGGFMVLSAVTTYPELWAAGIDIVGIANFVTFLENTGPWRRKIRESEYGSLENDREFLEQISPIRSVEQIVAPMFIVHGANDPRVPVGEAEQIVSALRTHQIPVEYLRFEDEGHGLIKRANRLIAYPAIARFLEKHLRENG